MQKVYKVDYKAQPFIKSSNKLNFLSITTLEESEQAYADGEIHETLDSALSDLEEMTWLSYGMIKTHFAYVHEEFLRLMQVKDDVGALCKGFLVVADAFSRISDLSVSDFEKICIANGFHKEVVCPFAY